MSFLRILILLPALCLGLLGQGNGWVLCQEACGHVALEVAHAAHGHEQYADHDCGHQAQDVPQMGQDTCHDVVLDAGHYVAPKPVCLPNLTLFVCGKLEGSASVRVCNSANERLPMRARPPPGQSAFPPLVLVCVRSVVRVV